MTLTGCTTPPEERASEPGATDLSAVSPALEAYDSEVIDGLWERDDLAARDRSLVTVAHLIAANQTGELQRFAERALNDGVTPAELSETVAHLAFYTGRQNAIEAAPAIAAAFDESGVDAADLPAADLELLALDPVAEVARDEQVTRDYGAIAPGLVQDTTDVLFNDLWLRPDLAPRDRSLVTVVALVSSGQVDQIPFHLQRAITNGLTETEVGGMLDQLAFFAGWRRVFTAVPVVRETLAAG
ncbi:carboxymuconolactone decarboxylase family protein [Clavibacter zhangzhiyongii]|uniref:carboxymuconolactone decarboxylase family protein n=1 Tax=Clavibacter zhangzhiyongii TaxID=2768071 RepID=UPI0039E01D87